VVLPPGAAADRDAAQYPQYVRINRDALLASTTLDRYRAHESALRNQWRTVNEVRSIEDLPPVDWGDEPNPSGGGTPAPADDNAPTGAEAPQPKGK
jgi:hypothetical protein